MKYMNFTAKRRKWNGRVVYEIFDNIGKGEVLGWVEQYTGLTKWYFKVNIGVMMDYGLLAEMQDFILYRNSRK